MDNLTIAFNETTNRYEATANGEHVGEVDVRMRDGVAELPHTGVEPQFRGGGVAAQLVKFALDDLRQQGVPYRPICPYIVAYIKKHPEYTAGLAD